MFFKFRDPRATQSYRMHLLPRADILTFEQVCDLASGLLALEEPLIFKTGSGGKTTDVMWFYGVFIFFFSERLRQLLHEGGVTGWTMYPVELYDRKDNHLPGYQGIAVTGGGVPARLQPQLDCGQAAACSWRSGLPGLSWPLL